MGSISQERPDLAELWDYKENEPYTPDTVSIDSTMNFRFTCKRCNNSWVSKPLYLKPLRACQFCYKRKVIKGSTDLESQYPNLAKEWDFERNYPITPDNITYGSNRIAWWICPNGHHYTCATVYRTGRNQGCQICASRQIERGINDFATAYPELMKEWDWERNEAIGLDPYKIARHAHIRANWKCKNGHTWKTFIYDRVSNGAMCPYCRTTNTSYPEQFIYWSFKEIFPNTVNRFKTTNGVEYDIYVPDIDLCIEYSGINWHKGKEDYDLMKEQLALKYHKKFISVIADHNLGTDIIWDKNKITINPNKNLDYLLEKIISIILDINHINYILDTSKIKEKAIEYSTGNIEYETSLEYKYPYLANEFDIEKNKILPSNIKSGSNKRAWWKCNKCGHSWNVAISNRVYNKSGCPKCRNKDYRR